MGRALDMSEISYLIRQDLQERLFTSYLWIHVFVDADLDQQDREVLVRNGLAARSLTLSIYDLEDAKGVVEYVTERCRNVEASHLKLFSDQLVVVDEEATERRLREAWEEDSVGEQHSGDSDKDMDWEQQFGIRSGELTIVGGLPGDGYIAHKDRRYDWDVILRINRECKCLNTLSVSWESNKLQGANLDLDQQMQPPLPAPTI
ncbi:hypothetical protein BG015_003723 [Linnemannia schmuckeri]|uniref:Uncharacterized protein n=1 Tax=Linnemannia schmuckeri TaxID=64567 RepID=A0A9P5S233_9FUNG|nr:hypothetical protein BG015_003723 [Linnemannia schmuckeri]